MVLEEFPLVRAIGFALIGLGFWVGGLLLIELVRRRLTRSKE